MFHVDCHDDNADEIILGQKACDATHKSRVLHLCNEDHDIDKSLGQTACDAAQHDDHQDVHGVQVEKMRIDEMTEEDMLRKLLEHEEHGHERFRRGGVFLEKGTGVCRGATERNGNLEKRDLEDPEV